MNNLPQSARSLLSQLVTTISTYPIPAAIGALGLAWLFVTRVIRKDTPSVSGQDIYGGLEMPVNPSMGSYDGSAMNSAKAAVDQVGTKIDQLSKAARRLGDDAQHHAEHLGSQVPGAIQSSRQDITDTAQKIANGIKNSTA